VLKLGVYSLEQIESSRVQWINRYLRRTYYVGLYEDAGRLDRETSRKLEERILSGFTVVNGVFKRTSSERMGQFDGATLATVKNLGCRKPLVVHDMAVSDGRTACDFFLKLSAEFDNCVEFYATDLAFKVTAVKQFGNRTIVVVDGKGNVLQLVYPPFVLPMRAIESWLFPINRILRSVLMHTAAKRIVKQYQLGDEKLECRELPLICSEARALLASRSNFHLHEYDLFDRAPRRYGLVRAMNIFNLSYFPPKTIKRALYNVFDSLNEGGLFVVGSNGDAGSTVNGGIYQKRGGSFSSLYRSGNGAAIDELVRQTNRSM
jgi:hypothetical protein